jgi:hypothetical protein
MKLWVAGRTEILRGEKKMRTCKKVDPHVLAESFQSGAQASPHKIETSPDCTIKHFQNGMAILTPTTEMSTEEVLDAMDKLGYRPAMSEEPYGSSAERELRCECGPMFLDHNGDVKMFDCTLSKEETVAIKK